MVVNKDIVAESIEHYGEDMQQIVCMEECTELAQVISKMLRGKVLKERSHLIEEMADVVVCLEILKQIHNIDDEDIQAWVDMKQEKVQMRILYGE